jgi:methionyl aminopeptidase
VISNTTLRSFVTKNSAAKPDKVVRAPLKAYPQSEGRTVPPHIESPPYALTGVVPVSNYHNTILIHDGESIDKMRRAARLARQALDVACSVAEPGVTTDHIDHLVHEFIIDQGGYPSPLNYAGFPKSLCSSINEVICHGIPDTRPLQFGDIVSFDVRYVCVMFFLSDPGVVTVLGTNQSIAFCMNLFYLGSCFIGGVHGDNCATVIVGDRQAADTIGVDWRSVPLREQFDTETDKAHFDEARRLVTATYECLYAGIHACRPGGCLTDVGAAIEDVANAYKYSSVQKYRGHGISSDFHIAPFVKHYRNSDKCELRPGMIFTIEPMITQGSSECFEWEDYWTVATKDSSLAAQFEHTVLITHDGVEILTLPE